MALDILLGGNSTDCFNNGCMVKVKDMMAWYNISLSISRFIDCSWKTWSKVNSILKWITNLNVLKSLDTTDLFSTNFCLKPPLLLHAASNSRAFSPWDSPLYTQHIHPCPKSYHKIHWKHSHYCQYPNSTQSYSNQSQTWTLVLRPIGTYCHLWTDGSWCPRLRSESFHRKGFGVTKFCSERGYH